MSNEGKRNGLPKDWAGKRRDAIIALGALLVCAAATQPSVESLHWKRRILILSAPSKTDAALAAQRRMLAGWEHGAADRDLDTVEVVGSEVRGASDDANRLRSRYRIPAAGFYVVLVGKDGNVAKRSAKPIAAADLQAAIDAMPMRRAGER
jgi:hypothetical protein